MTRPAPGSGVRVFNRREQGVPAEAVYVGRPSRWGNPMTVSDVVRLFPTIDLVEAHRRAALWYAEYLAVRPELVEAARRELAGRDLACWCAPLPCHAQVLAWVAQGGCPRELGE